MAVDGFSLLYVETGKDVVAVESPCMLVISMTSPCGDDELFELLWVSVRSVNTKLLL